MRAPRRLLAIAGLAAIAAAPLQPPELGPDLAGCVAPHLAATLVTSRPTTPPVPAQVAGVDLLVVTDPSIAPGYPVPLLSTPAGACGLEVFNRVDAAVAAGDAIGAATRFASIAGMSWLGDVRVDDVTADGDTVRLTTAGGRHGVVSDWTLEVDHLGVRRASFTSTAFGVAVDLHDVHDLEGVTSLPGHSRSWTRSADGLVRLDVSMADDLAASLAERDAAAARAAAMTGQAPGDFLEHTFADGQTIRFTYGVAATPVETVRTGVPQADRLMTLHAGLGELYRDLAGWGLVDPWENTSRTLLGAGTELPDDAGYVNIDSGLSAVCLACAYVTDAVEIHMAYAFPDVAPEVVGASYPDREAFFVDVLGHELVHSMQGGYSDGRAGPLSNSFLEATARAAEALFENSANTFQPGSIAYLDNANGCEGFDNGRGGWVAAQAAGPFVGHTYDSCYFWWTYYAEHGPTSLIALLEALPATLADRAGQDVASLNLELLDVASPVGDGTLDLARWAGAYAYGSAADGYTITGASGVPQDWFAFLDDVEDRSTTLSPGRSRRADVADGGTRAFRVRADATVTEVPEGELFLLDAVDGELVLLGPAGVGTAVADGQVLVVVAPTAGEVEGSVAIG